jgi:protein SCO1
VPAIVGKQTMRSLKPIALSLAVLAASVPNAAAHSLGDLEGMLGDREKYFQPIDREAPDFTLEDADKSAVALEDLEGKVVVLHFVYTSCPDVCPLHAERIAEIQEMVNQTPMRELVQFVTITTDPEHDTPEVMREYGSAHGLDPANWMFLTSGADRPEDTTRTLAERFGHTFTQTEDGYQIHGVVTHVIDHEGRWQANFHGLKFDPTNLVVYVNALTNAHGTEGHPGPGWWETIRSMF